MKIREAIALGQGKLTGISSTPQKDTLVLLAHILNENLTYVISHDNEEVQEKQFLKLLKRLEANEPLEYITNKADFYGRDFYVDNRVLIPRPATEDVIEKLLDEVDSNKEYSIAEIGVGSGAISVTLAKFLPNANIVATDICEHALKVANKNVKKHKVEKQVTLVHSNLLDEVSEPIDILISNPPYINENFKLPKNVEYEPKTALFAKDDGLALIKQIVDLAIKKNVKLLVVEMGYDQKEMMQEYLSSKNLEATFFQDFEEIDRGFVCRLSPI